MNKKSFFSKLLRDETGALNIGVFDSKTHLSELVQNVEEKGHVYYITKRGRPVAELRPVQGAKKLRLVPGCGKHEHFWMAPDFDKIPEDFKEYV